MATKIARKLIVSAALNVGIRKSRRSSIGSASVRWRRTNSDAGRERRAASDGERQEARGRPGRPASARRSPRGPRRARGRRSAGRAGPRRVAVLGQHDRAEDQQQGHHRHARSGTPSPTRSARAARRRGRADRAAGRERRDPDADGAGALPGSSNMLKISDSVDGARVAPAIPSSARLAMSISGVVENAARIETAPNAAAPISSSRRRPIRSPSVPIVIEEARRP